MRDIVLFQDEYIHTLHPLADVHHGLGDSAHHAVGTPVRSDPGIKDSCSISVVMMISPDLNRRTSCPALARSDFIWPWTAVSSDKAKHKAKTDEKEKGSLSTPVHGT